MEKDIEKTVVIFRKFPDGEILAVFPEIPGDSDPSTCLSYVHMGQHGACAAFYSDITKPATPKEYADLKAELENHCGYNLDIKNRNNRKYHDARMKEYWKPYKNAEVV